jgi:signal transduction histidine kinase
MMDRQVRHMVRLIDDLLDLSRITRDRIELRMDAVSLRSVLDQALEACTPMYEHARQLLVVDPPPEHLRVHGDAARLVQVFSNLLTNASKFTPPGGRIEVGHRVDGRLATITVSDTGRGIPAERLQDVFEMFTQLSSPLDRHHGGLGIGLTLSRRLVQMHGGQLTAASEGEGKGSTFSVSLPLMEAATRREDQPPAP